MQRDESRMETYLAGIVLSMSCSICHEHNEVARVTWAVQQYYKLNNRMKREENDYLVGIILGYLAVFMPANAMAN